MKRCETLESFAIKMQNLLIFIMLFTMFLEFVRIMISSYPNALKMQNLYGSHNAVKLMKCNEFPQIRSQHMMNILIFHLFHDIFCIPLNASFGSLPRHTGESNCCGLWQSLKHFKHKCVGQHLLSCGASREPRY